MQEKSLQTALVKIQKEGVIGMSMQENSKDCLPEGEAQHYQTINYFSNRQV